MRGEVCSDTLKASCGLEYREAVSGPLDYCLDKMKAWVVTRSVGGAGLPTHPQFTFEFLST